jgi:hypothetical protein
MGFPILSSGNPGFPYKIITIFDGQVILVYIYREEHDVLVYLCTVELLTQCEIINPSPHLPIIFYGKKIEIYSSTYFEINNTLLLMKVTLSCSKFQNQFILSNRLSF